MYNLQPYLSLLFLISNFLLLSHLDFFSIQQFKNRILCNLDEHFNELNSFDFLFLCLQKLIYFLMFKHNHLDFYLLLISCLNLFFLFLMIHTIKIQFIQYYVHLRFHFTNQAIINDLILPFKPLSYLPHQGLHGWNFVSFVWNYLNFHHILLLAFL